MTNDRRMLVLTHVLQSRNRIGDSGAELIGEGLKVNRSLRVLSLVRLVFIFGLCYRIIGCQFGFFELSESSSQNDQSSGPLSSSVSSTLMLRCQTFNLLSFDCINWSACVESDSWGELPVPPAGAIARGTQGVFEFVKAMLRGGAVSLRGEVFAMDCNVINLQNRNLMEDKLLPLLENFGKGRFSSLQTLNLVITHGFNVTDARSDSCAAGWK
jgi:hypothetical protein